MKIFKTERIIYFRKKTNPKSSITPKKPTNVTNNYNINSDNILGKKFNLYKINKFLVTHEEEKTDEGRWTLKEHIQFLQGLDKFGIKWKKIKALITTRSMDQIRSHAQKFYNKLKLYKDEELGIDFTKDKINSLKEMINHVKNINSNYNIVTLFLYISEKINSNKKNKKNKKSNIKAQIEPNFDKDGYMNNNNINSNEQVNIFNSNYMYDNINIKENNIHNELNFLEPINNNFNNFPMNNIFITNFNFINDCNNPFINNFLNNLPIKNNISSDINRNNILSNNLNNYYVNNSKDLLNMNFVPNYALLINANIILRILIISLNVYHYIIYIINKCH